MDLLLTIDASRDAFVGYWHIRIRHKPSMHNHGALIDPPWNDSHEDVIGETILESLRCCNLISISSKITLYAAYL